MEELLAGPIGTQLLVLLGRLPEGVELVQGLTSVVGRLIQRLRAEAEPGLTAPLPQADFAGWMAPDGGAGGRAREDSDFSPLGK